MKLIWATLISLAFLLLVAAITLYLLIHYSVFSSHEINDQPLFEPTLEGYKNHQLIQFSPTNDQDIENLVELQDRLNLIPWSKVLRPGWPVIFQVPPNQVRHLSLSSEALHLPFIQLTSNMQDYLKNKKNVITEFKLDKSEDFNLNRYHYYTEIERYLTKLGEENPDKLVVKTYGNSVENRQLYYVKIFQITEEAGEKSLKKNKTVILECGAHSREWLSPAVCLHVINSLIHDKDSYELLKEYEFYILPLINPDGYAYSWTRDRMWRKNRRRFANNCYGVDLNRNFNIGFNTSEIPENIHLMKDLEDLEMLGNTTRVRRFLESNKNNSIQCSNLYPGERPFSENETFYLKRLIDQFKVKPNVYISLHSYSQMWLYPFGTKSLISPIEKKLDKYAKLGVDHLQRAGINQTQWKSGSAYNIMYNAGGISIDWAHKDVGIELVYTLEMRDNGMFGFLLPEDQIKPAFKEAWGGLSAVLFAYAEDLNNSIETTE